MVQIKNKSRSIWEIIRLIGNRLVAWLGVKEHFRDGQPLGRNARQRFNNQQHTVSQNYGTILRKIFHNIKLQRPWRFHHLLCIIWKDSENLEECLRTRDKAEGQNWMRMIFRNSGSAALKERYVRLYSLALFLVGKHNYLLPLKIMKQAPLPHFLASSARLGRLRLLLHSAVKYWELAQLLFLLLEFSKFVVITYVKSLHLIISICP